VRKGEAAKGTGGNLEETTRENESIRMKSKEEVEALVDFC
jgi:hypothetical protein